jgi:hypothetical protein
MVATIMAAVIIVSKVELCCLVIIIIIIKSEVSIENEGSESSEGFEKNAFTSQ